MDVKVKNFILNKLTKAQYESALAAGEVNETELYLLTDDNEIIPGGSGIPVYEGTIENPADISGCYAKGEKLIIAKGYFKVNKNIFDLKTGGESALIEITKQFITVKNHYAQSFIEDSDHYYSQLTSTSNSDLVIDAHSGSPITDKIFVRGKQYDLTWDVSDVSSPVPFLAPVDNGTDGQVLTSHGYSHQPTWETPTSGGAELTPEQIQNINKIPEKLDIVGTAADSYLLNGEDKSQIIAGLATETYVISKVEDRIATLVNSAPEALDTLNELSKALGDDPNFSATISTEIGKKQEKLSPTQLNNINDVPNKINTSDRPTIISEARAGLANIVDLESLEARVQANEDFIQGLEDGNRGSY